VVSIVLDGVGAIEVSIIRGVIIVVNRSINAEWLIGKIARNPAEVSIVSVIIVSLIIEKVIVDDCQIGSV